MKRFFIRLWFKIQLKRGKLIKVDDRHRGVGKTTMMLDFARKNNLAIVVGNQQHANLVRYADDDIDIIRLAENFTFEIKGNAHNYPNGVVIDESLNPKMIVELRTNGFRIRGGFIQNYGSDK